MEMNLTRRSFFLGAASLSVWPADLFSAAEIPAHLVSIWERPDGSASDCVTVRRLYLDLAGRIPTKEEAVEYVSSKDPDKRGALVAKLLESSDFADYWTMRFCDILRVKSEFPVNLWPNAVYVYHGRIRSFVKNNEPWDRFGRALLTAQGSNFRDAEVNFFRATDRRDPDGWVEAVARTFLGVEPEALDPGLRKEFASCFLNLRIKKTREWKEEIVYVDGEDRRGRLCDMLFSDRSCAAAGAFFSRIRRWLFGPGASASGPERSSFCGLKTALRAMVDSPEYMRGSVTGGFPARRLDAEVLDDIFCAIGDSGRNYHSPAPEPFTYLPPERPTVAIEDGSVSSGFLSLFGRPARDTGSMDERGSGVTSKQRLYLFNSGDIHRKLTRLAMPRWKLDDGSVNPYHRQPEAKRLEDVFWRLLSRPPSRHERAVVSDEWKKRRVRNRKARYGELMRDVAWSIVNTKEFMFRI